MPLTNNYILTEGSDFLNTEGSDRLITEGQSETGGAGTASLLPGRWQYQSLFEVFIQTAAPALDKLQPILDIIGPYIPRPARALPTAILAGSFFMPFPVQPPVPRMDSWYQVTERPPKDFKRQQYTFEFYAAPDRQPEPPKLSWVFRQPERIDRLRDIRWTYPSLARPDRQPDPPQLSWYPAEEIKAREPVDLSYIPQGDFSADPIPIIPPAGLFPQVSDGKAREPVDLSYIPQGDFSSDPIPIVMPDKWHPGIEKKPDDFKDQQYIVPEQYIHWSGVEGDYVGTWHPQIVQPLALPDRQFQSEFRTEVVVTGAEVITLDKWYQETQRPTRRAPSNVLLPGPVGVILPVVATVDRWMPNAGIPVFVRQRAQFQAEFRVDRAITAAVVSLDWLPTYQSIIWARPSRTYITIGDLILTPAQRPEAVSVDRWFQPIVQPVRTILRVPPERLVEPVFITPEGAVTLDKWFREPVGPKFLRANFNYIFASGVEFFTIVPPAGAGNDRLIIVDGRFAIRIGKRTYTFI